MLIFTSTPLRSTPISSHPPFHVLSLSCFVYNNSVQWVLWVWDHCLNEVNQPGTRPLKKSDTPFPRRHQLSRTPQLGVWAHEVLSAPCWNVICLDLLQVLCRQPQLLSVHDGSFCHAQNAAVVQFYMTSGSCSLPPPSFSIVSEGCMCACWGL